MNRRHFIAALAALTLAACSSDPAPPDMFYRLGTPGSVPAIAGGPIKGTIEVPPFRAEGVVNERAILYREGPRALQQYSYHSWSEPPAAMVQQAFLAGLRSAQAFTLVGAPDMRLDRDFELTGNIRQLEHVLAGGAGKATIEIDIVLRRVRDNQVLIAKTYRGEEPASSNDIDATVGAFSKVMDKIVADFVTDLGPLPKTAPAPR